MQCWQGLPGFNSLINIHELIIRGISYNFKYTKANTSYELTAGIMAKFLIEVPHNEDRQPASAPWKYSSVRGTISWPTRNRVVKTVTKLFQITHEDVKRYKEKHKLESTEDYHS
jgi:hypothetical protein